MRSLILFAVAIGQSLLAVPATQAGEDGCRKYLPSVGKTVNVPCDREASDQPTSAPVPRSAAQLSLEDIKLRYGNVEEDGGEWLVKRGAAALTTGFKPSLAGQLASGEQISLMGCKASCREDAKCAAFYWGSAHASNSDVCYLYGTQVIDTVTSQGGGVWFKHAR